MRNGSWHVLVALVLMAGALAMPAAAATGAIDASQGRLLRDGQPWTPRGFTFDAFVAPPGEIIGVYAKAQQRYGAQELSAVKNVFNADTIRLQISQNFIDAQPNNAYVAMIVDGVRQARQQGLAVILSLRGHPPFGSHAGEVFPNAETAAAWQVLAPHFAGDTGVMFEIYTEPAWRIGSPAADWAYWRAGMQPLVDAIRAAGARNVLILPGMHGDKTLDGATPPNDPLHNYIWAVHPYPVVKNRGGELFSDIQPSDWDSHWGRFCSIAGNICVVTEWDATSSKKCRPLSDAPLDTPTIAKTFLSYIQSKNIGMAAAWPFDWGQGLLVRDFNDFAPTYFDQNFQCDGDPKEGPGTLLQKMWHGEALD